MLRARPTRVRPSRLSKPALRSVRSSTLQFYLDRAAQARNEAEAATLEHVRERCRRSEAAWTELAERAERNEQMRVAEALRKADQVPD
jgi:hypothetical protein